MRRLSISNIILSAGNGALVTHISPRNQVTAVNLTKIKFALHDLGKAGLNQATVKCRRSQATDNAASRQSARHRLRGGQNLSRTAAVGVGGKRCTKPA